MPYLMTLQGPPGLGRGNGMQATRYGQAPTLLGRLGKAMTTPVPQLLGVRGASSGGTWINAIILMIGAAGGGYVGYTLGQRKHGAFAGLGRKRRR